MEIDHAAVVVENWARASVDELIETAEKVDSGMRQTGSHSMDSKERDKEVLAVMQRCLQNLADELAALRSEARELDD